MRKKYTNELLQDRLLRRDLLQDFLDGLALLFCIIVLLALWSVLDPI